MSTIPEVSGVVVEAPYAATETDVVDTALGQWRRDRQFRQVVPRTRRFVGLAARVTARALGRFAGHELYHNDTVSWVALRDVPARYFPRLATGGVVVNYATSTKAALVGGLPKLDFCKAERNAWDVPIPPQGGPSDAATFEVLAAVSAAMTLAAYCGIDGNGLPHDPVWADAAHDAGVTAGRFRVPLPESWLPKPYLAFPRARGESLYAFATRRTLNNGTIACARCRTEVTLEHLRARRMAGGKVIDVAVSEDGDLFATCPKCRIRRKWHLDDAAPARTERFWSPAFMADFCEAVTYGLPLYAREAGVYLGEESRETTTDGDISLAGHVFRVAGSDEVVRVYVPTWTRVEVAVNSELAPGQHWATIHAREVGVEDITAADPAAEYLYVARSRLARWTDWSLEDRWAKLATVIRGGEPYVGICQQLFFESSCLRHGDELLVPASYVYQAVKDIPPVDLYWDFEGLEDHYVDDLGAFVFPPIPLLRWDKLRFALGTNGTAVLDVNCGVSDVRFEPQRRFESQRRGAAPVPGDAAPR